jgi:hypothetical protein
MNWYVRIDSLKGQQSVVLLADLLYNRGFDPDGVYYHAGGWIDNSIKSCYPHLHFSNEADAIAFTLTYGGECTREPPYKSEMKDKEEY